MKGKTYLWFISLVATIGGLMFGFDIGIISGAVPFIQTYFGWNELQLGWGVSSILLGCIAGAFGTGMITERYGRKRVMLVVALFFAVSCAGMALSRTAVAFITFRILGGIAVGAVSVLSPMYVAEVAPPRIRGTLVTIYQLAITLGILISYLVNFALHDVENNWRWMFATGLVPSVAFFAGLMFIPESPRWLVKAGKLAQAGEILERIGGKEYAASGLAGIRKSLEDTGTGNREAQLGIVNREDRPKTIEGGGPYSTRGSTGPVKGSPGSGILFSRRYRSVIILGLLLAVFVQISGINTVVDYAPKILISAGVEIRSALLQTSLIGLVNFAFTFIAVWLIDRLGRRTFYIIGSSGMAITLLMLSAAFHFNLDPALTTIFIMLFIAFFASCIGPAFWTLVSEMFPNRIRGRAVALASFTQWVFNFLVVLLFPHVLDVLGGSVTFLFLAVMSAGQLLVAIFFLKETRGKTLEEIGEMWEPTS